MKKWYVYIVRCADQTLYTGITKNTNKRIAEHNQDNRLAAKYTKARRPVTLVYSEPFPDRSAAAKREAEIKKMSKRRKEMLTRSHQGAG